MSDDRFDGFPASGAATVLPNLFYSRVLPGLPDADALLAFLWTAKVVQEKRGELRCSTAAEIWQQEGAAAAFERLGSGESGLCASLEACVSARALLCVRSAGRGGELSHYFLNTPQSRKAIARVRTGELQLRPQSVVVEAVRTAPSAVFRLYESRIGTISPFVGKRLAEAAARYPLEWIEDAVNEAAPTAPRNWRNVELILESWERRGRAYEASGRHPRQDR